MNNSRFDQGKFDEETLKEMQKEIENAFAQVARDMQTGDFQRELEAYQKRQEKSKKIRGWLGYISLTLVILGLIFLPQVILPVNLLKVGLFALWLALGVFLNR